MSFSHQISLLKLWFLAGAFIVMVFVPSLAVAESTFELQIVDKNGESVGEAQVTFLEIDDEWRTDKDSRLVIEVPHSGEHTVLIETADHEPKWVQIEISGASRSRTFIVGESNIADDQGNFTLRTTTGSPLRNSVAYQPIESLSRDDLQRRSANSYGEMLDGTPGVSSRSFGSAPSRPVIRGLGGERVLVLQNGERTGDVSSTAHDHHISGDPLEAEQVDVVRGPASLLYGSSALGGVVNIMDQRIPREWDEGLFSEASLYGAMGQTTGAGAATVGYGFENSAVRSRFSYRMADDLRTPDGILPDTGIQGLTLDLGGSREIEAGLYGMSVGFQNLVFGLPEAFDDPDESVELRSQRFFSQAHAERELSGFFTQAEWRLLASYYEHEEIEIEAGPDGQLEEELELGYQVFSVSSSLTLAHGEIGPIDQGALGIQLRGRDLGLHGEEVLSPDSQEASAAVYIFEEVPVSEIFRFQFGVRPEVHLMAPLANEEFDHPGDTRISPTLSASMGVHIQPGEHFDIGAQVARAHRVPIVEELYSDAPHLGTGQYEIGDSDLANEIGYGGDIHTRFGTNMIQTSFALFFNRINNFIFLEPTGEEHAPSGYPIYQYQGADAQLWGGEWTVQFRPWRSWEVSTVVDYVRGQRISPELEDLPSMPPLRARVEAGWNGDEFWSLGRLRVAASQERTPAGEDTTPGYALLDFEGGFRLHGTGSHNFSLRFANILDTPYRDHLSRVRGIASPMPGRSLHATYRWTY